MLQSFSGCPFLQWTHARFSPGFWIGTRWAFSSKVLSSPGCPYKPAPTSEGSPSGRIAAIIGWTPDASGQSGTRFLIQLEVIEQGKVWPVALHVIPDYLNIRREFDVARLGETSFTWLSSEPATSERYNENQQNKSFHSEFIKSPNRKIISLLALLKRRCSKSFCFFFKSMFLRSSAVACLNSCKLWIPQRFDRKPKPGCHAYIWWILNHVRSNILSLNSIKLTPLLFLLFSKYDAFWKQINGLIAEIPFITSSRERHPYRIWGSNSQNDDCIHKSSDFFRQWQ